MWFMKTGFLAVLVLARLLAGTLAESVNFGISFVYCVQRWEITQYIYFVTVLKWSF